MHIENFCKEFVFFKWKKPERLIKYHKNYYHDVAMTKWVAFRENKRRKTSIAK